MYYVTTDTHLGHDNIIEYCDRPLDYNKRIYRGLSVLRLEDTLIHLGDVGFTTGGEKAYLAIIPCRKWLLLGNHDNSTSFHLSLGWDWAGEEMSIRRFGKLIRFTHKPKPIGEEDIQIHGHFHNNPIEYCEGWLTQYYTSKHKLLILEETNG